MKLVRNPYSAQRDCRLVLISSSKDLNQGHVLALQSTLHCWLLTFQFISGARENISNLNRCASSMPALSRCWVTEPHNRNESSPCMPESSGWLSCVADCQDTSADPFSRLVRCCCRPWICSTHLLCTYTDSRKCEDIKRLLVLYLTLYWLVTFYHHCLFQKWVCVSVQQKVFTFMAKCNIKLTPYHKWLSTSEQNDPPVTLLALISFSAKQ